MGMGLDPQMLAILQKLMQAQGGGVGGLGGVAGRPSPDAMLQSYKNSVNLQQSNPLYASAKAGMGGMMGGGGGGAGAAMAALSGGLPSGIGDIANLGMNAMNAMGPMAAGIGGAMGGGGMAAPVLGAASGLLQSIGSMFTARKARKERAEQRSLQQYGIASQAGQSNTSALQRLMQILLSENGQRGL